MVIHINNYLAQEFAFNVLSQYDLISLGKNGFASYFIPCHAVLCFFLCIPQKLSAARYVSFAASIVITLMSFVFIFYQPSYKKFYEENGAEFEVLNVNKMLFTNYCLALFSSVNQFAVVSILSEFKNPTQRRVNKVKCQ